MILQSVLLQHIRNYSHSRFDFSPARTILIGENTVGKTNLSESLYLLATGKSFKTNDDSEMIAFNQDVGRVQGLLVSSEEKTKIEVVLASSTATGNRFSKKFLINGVAKTRNALRGLLPLILFRPEELEIIIDGPALRRNFLDDVLSQVDKDYANAKNTYERSLRQRNALLRVVQESGKRNSEQFAYWDSLLIESGQILTQKREAFLQFVNMENHEIFPIQTVYDKSTISYDRLEQYKEAEIGAGVTLVGPHRDDFSVEILIKNNARDIRRFGSRGQQRLAVLQLKLLQIAYIRQILQVSPLLVLDDIFSELDSHNIQLVLDKVGSSQIILTTTHKEFISKALLKKSVMIELEKRL